MGLDLGRVAAIVGQKGGDRRRFDQDPIGSVACDSRLVRQRGLFVALEGDRVDGHRFLEEVRAKGGVAAIVASGYHGPSFGLELFRVDSPLSALHLLARQHLKEHLKGQLIGVVGSVGKTTTKELIATLLSPLGHVGKTVGNANSQVGLPLTILNELRDQPFFVLEMGIGSWANMESFRRLISPSIGCLTGLYPAHMEGYRDFEELVAAKTQLLGSSAVVVLHTQTLLFDRVRALPGRKITYGTSQGDYVLKQVRGEIVVHEQGRELLRMAAPFQAPHFLENLAGAIAVARHCGVEREQLTQVIPVVSSLAHRFTPIDKKGVTFIDDSYNAIPEAVKRALLSLSSFSRAERRIGVLGEMEGLGNHFEQAHRDILKLGHQQLDLLFCIGKRWREVLDSGGDGVGEVLVCDSVEEAQQRLFDRLEKGDLVLIKGPHSMKLWELIAAF